MDEAKNSNTESQSSSKIFKCHQCEKPAALIFNQSIPLCVDCYYKVVQANFMEEQILHNKMSWITTHLNFIQQKIYEGHGGLLPLKQVTIPQPLSAPGYSSNQIKISDRNIDVISIGTMNNINTSIAIMQNRGEQELANEVKQLTQAIINNKEINDELKSEIVEQLEFLVTEALAAKDRQRKSLMKKMLTNIAEAVKLSSSLVTLWSKVEPLIKASVGM